ncbi:MAG: SRPBCC domain-containing protein [Phycisphaerales bacterium]|nr:SRPBCC domain-containing protein [Hyphomonadaceae bacterium]
MSEAPVIRIARRIEAPAERVFDAWLDPAMIGRFMFGTHLRDEQVASLTNEARVGGRFSYKVIRGGALIDHTGTYREIERPRRLVFTWGVGEEQGDLSVVTIEIAAKGEACELTLTHRLHPDWADYAERTQAGWTKIVGDLAAAVE